MACKQGGAEGGGLGGGAKKKKSNIFNDYFSHRTKLISHGQEMNEGGEDFLCYSTLMEGASVAGLSGCSGPDVAELTDNWAENRKGAGAGWLE